MLKRVWLGIERRVLFCVIRLFRIREETERIARGFALGVIVNFFPTFGFGVAISAFLARLFGGNAVAGLIGGASLTPVWPVLFYLNMQIGSHFFTPRVIIDEPQDVTPETIDAFVWGATFTVGAILNALVAGLLSYLLILGWYTRVRPHALGSFRKHARYHQWKFRRTKSSCLS